MFTTPAKVIHHLGPAGSPELLTMLGKNATPRPQYGSWLKVYKVASLLPQFIQRAPAKNRTVFVGFIIGGDRDRDVVVYIPKATLQLTLLKLPCFVLLPNPRDVNWVGATKMTRKPGGTLEIYIPKSIPIKAGTRTVEIRIDDTYESVTIAVSRTRRNNE